MNMRNEKISAHLDGEIHRDELMAFSLSGEESDSRVGLRYQMIGDILRGEMSEFNMQDVSRQVREALANEELANENIAAIPVSSTANPAASQQTSPAGWRSLLSSWWRPAAGLALAASVAMVMIVLGGQPHEKGAAPVVAVQTPPPAPLPQQYEARVRPVAHVIDRRLTPYLDQHFATQETLQGRMPYVRSVSYEQQR